MSMVIGDGLQPKDLGFCRTQDDCNSMCSIIHQDAMGICNSNGGALQKCLCYNCKTCEINLPVGTIRCDESQCKLDCFAKFQERAISSYCQNMGSIPIFNSCHCRYCC